MGTSSLRDPLWTGQRPVPEGKTGEFDESQSKLIWLNLVNTGFLSPNLSIVVDSHSNNRCVHGSWPDTILLSNQLFDNLPPNHRREDLIVCIYKVYILDLFWEPSRIWNKHLYCYSSSSNLSVSVHAYKIVHCYQKNCCYSNQNFKA